MFMSLNTYKVTLGENLLRSSLLLFPKAWVSTVIANASNPCD